MRLRKDGNANHYAYTSGQPAPAASAASSGDESAAKNRSPIEKLLRPIKDRQLRREALMDYERATKAAIQARGDLSGEERQQLLEELSSDLEQARMMLDD